MTTDSRSAENGAFELPSNSHRLVSNESAVQIQTVGEILELLLREVENNVFAATAHKNNEPDLFSTDAVSSCEVSINDAWSAYTNSSIERPKNQHQDVYKYFRLLSGRVTENNTSTKQATKRQKVVIEQPKYSSGNMPDLEPGEVPDPNYVPPSVVDSTKTVYCQVYPCDSSLMTVPFYLFNYVTRETLKDTLDNEDFITASFEDGVENDALAPADFLQPSKTIEQLFQVAKQKVDLLRKCGLSSFGNSDEAARATVFPSFPNTGGQDERKYKQYKRNKEYKIRFTNNLGALRHHRSRWIKGGRLTTAGKFEEVDSSNEEDKESKPILLTDGTIYLKQKSADDSDAGEVAEINAGISEVKTLLEENVVLPPPKRKFPTHIVYEDTHQYPEYLKYYAELHANQYPGAYDDEQTAWQRRWFQYYCHAVQFVDIPDEFKNEHADNEAKAVAADKAKQQHFTSLFNVEDLSLAEKLELYYQQWRWKQINQYQNPSSSTTMTSLRDSSNFIAAMPSWTDGVSVGGQPVMYDNHINVPQKEVKPEDLAIG